MFTKVLWATDGSASADRALPIARGLAKDEEAELLVVHCDELTLPAKGGVFSVNVDEQDLARKIRQQVDELVGAGVRASMETRRARVGGAAHEIADAAREQGTDVIVVGTRGHNPLGGLLLGSVTQRLLHIAPCPVLAVPPTGAVKDA